MERHRPGGFIAERLMRLEANPIFHHLHTQWGTTRGAGFSYPS